MKRKITAVLLCVVLVFTLSVNAAAQNESIDIVSDTEEVISQNVVEPRIQNGSIVDNGVYRIKNVNSGKYLNVHYGVDADHTNIYQWTGDGSTEQKWRVSYNLATDAYQIYSMSSSGGKYRCVDVTRGSTPLTSGQNIKLYKPTDPTSQELQIMSIGNSQYKIVMKQNTSLCLTAYGTSNGTSAGTTSTSAGNVFISTYTGAANQKWTFEYTNSTVVVPPTGWLDSVSSTAISGWIWRSDLPNSPVKVYFNLVNNDTGDEYNFTTNANVYRSDLLNAGYGNGYHGFSYTIDWRDYLPGNYTVNVFGAEGAVYYLSGSPKTYFNDGETLGETKTWNYSTYINGTYVPKVGWAQPTFYRTANQNLAKTYCEFTLDNYNVENILNYNAGTHEANSKNLYLTLDVTNVPSDGIHDKMDAYLIYTSLPNPKEDYEDDLSDSDERKEESEVVALGEVEATTYFMTTWWVDYRNSNANDKGQWQVQFAMSGQYVGLPNTNIWIGSNGDYNNVTTANIVQAIMKYGIRGGVEQ